MRRKLALMSAATVLAATGVFAVAHQAFAAAGCSAKYTIVGQWAGGFQAQVDVTNLGDAITSWNVGWDFGNSSQTISQIWNATKTQSALHVTATNMNYNGAVATNGTISFGFLGTWSGSNPAGANFTLNNTACTGNTGGGGSPSPSTSPSSSPSPNAPTVALTSPSAGSTFTAPATVSLAATASTPSGTISKVDFFNGSTLLGTDTSSPYTFNWTNVGAGSYSLTARATNSAGLATTSTLVQISVTTGGGGGTHVDNPFVGARGYVHPDRANQARADGGAAIANVSTGIWLDRIAAING